MGSSVNFPVQTLVYSAVAFYAYVKHMYPETPISEQLIKTAHKSIKDNLVTREPDRMLPFRCYGDDIVTDSKVTDSVVALLTELGFRVNRGKSFTGACSFVNRVEVSSSADLT